MYSKSTETAIAAMSRLAEVYDGGETLLSAGQIAESRGLPGPFVAKILSAMSQADMVLGTRGPSGGFTLARPPQEIMLYDVFSLFEPDAGGENCPFGGGICGKGDACPLHDRLLRVHQVMEKMLRQTSFDVFRKAYRKNQGAAAWQLCLDGNLEES